MNLENAKAEIQSALNDLTGNFEKRFGTIEEKMDQIADLSAHLEKVEARMNRKGLGLGGDNSKHNPEETKSFRDFVRSGTMDAKTVMAGSGPDGGYTIPSQLAEQIENLELKQSVMRRLAKVQPVSTVLFTQLVNKHGSGSGWVNETSQRPNTASPSLSAVTFNDCEIYANPIVTQRILDDSAYDIDAWLTQELADAFVDQEGDAFINGNTPTRPTGFLALTNAPVATDDSTRPFGTLQYVASGDANALASTNPGDALIDLVQSVKAKYRLNAAWIMNPKTLGGVRKIKDTTGRYLFQESLVANTPSTLLGYAVYEDDHMPDLGANKFPIAFGNFFRGYTIIDRQDIRVQRDPFTQKGYIQFYSTKRVSGNVVNSEAFKLLKCAVS